MVTSYAKNGDSFVADKPRLWSEQRFFQLRNRSFNLHPDGERVAIASAQIARMRQPLKNSWRFFPRLRRRQLTKNTCSAGLLRTTSASSRSRRASCSLLGNQLVSQCLRIGDVLLVAVRIDPNVWSLRVGLHLLVLAG